MGLRPKPPNEQSRQFEEPYGSSHISFLWNSMPRRETALTFKSGQSGEESHRRFFDSPLGGLNYQSFQEPEKIHFFREGNTSSSHTGVPQRRGKSRRIREDSFEKNSTRILRARPRERLSILMISTEQFFPRHYPPAMVLPSDKSFCRTCPG